MNLYFQYWPSSALNGASRNKFLVTSLQTNVEDQISFINCSNNKYCIN